MFGQVTENIGFTPIDNIILLSRYLTDAELRVYLVIKSFAYGKKRHCWPSQETIAHIVGKNRETVNRIIQSLKKKGLITIIQRGFRQSCIYIFQEIPTSLVKGYQEAAAGLAVTEKSLLEVPQMSHEEEKKNNTNVVVENKLISEILEEDKPTPVASDQAPQIKEQTNNSMIVKEKQAPQEIPTSDQIQKILDCIKDATGFVSQPYFAIHLLKKWDYNYVFDKIDKVARHSRIDSSVTGFIASACWSNWKEPKGGRTEYHRKEKPKKTKEKENSYQTGAKKKALIKSLYLS